jgi:hypothetical protein
MNLTMSRFAFLPVALFITAFFTCLQAQRPPVDIFYRLEVKRPGQGTVRITQDANIRNLVNLHVSQQRKINGIKGYRILIYMGSGQNARKEQDQVRAGFIRLYEDVNSYSRFEYPYFKVYVGDFRTKSEALKFLKQIEGVYPDAFVRDDIVAFPD